jgi:cupin fold WbuC family metalloprotein
MKVFSRQYFDDLLSAASQSDRLRAHANVHGSYADQCQKLFNAICIDSYIRPHRHSLDPKEECLIAIKGLFGLIIFTDQGVIESITFFGSEKYSEKLSIASGLELPARVWHTIISLEDDSVLFEVKGGPFNPSLAKEFAPWAPDEGTQHAGDFFEKIKQEVLKFRARSLDTDHRRRFD